MRDKQILLNIVTLKNNIMNEENIWKGSPSQWINFGFYLLCIPLTLVFGLGLLLAIWKYFDTHLHKFEITDQRILEHKGIFSKTTDEIELYRVKDLRHEQPFFLRLVGLSNIVLDTTDRSNPVLQMKGLAQGHLLKEQLRVAVDKRRDIKGVKEVDFK
ncbi:PH domain-containing protein [Zobellia galactanivorans]|uniref:PH domain-containing protein n=1 Tax=Zobellia galactanivorans (strain DSM 12802 / CCUG 47099 / CIP 106680 / NCIMB 13871 / Dsij) TaxID=63186 RepID=UPI001C06D712|nr:PH domain-containing protein [Zobellia galactanivorans]MBU3025353.1 PH domain-containing protein [Zobellia galactanivorans]